MMQNPHLQRCEQCNNLVAKLFLIRHEESKRELNVCASCYGLELARKENSGTPPERS